MNSTQTRTPSAPMPNMNTNSSAGHPPRRGSHAGFGSAGLAVAIISMAGLLALPAPANAQSRGVPVSINYQGKLTDSKGALLTAGYYEVAFRIWDNATQAEAGNFKWGRAFPLNLMSNGVFNVLLTDDGSPVTTPGTPAVSSLRSAFLGTDRFLGLTITRNPLGAVSSPQEIVPRQQMVSAPFALQSGQSGQADWATFATNAGTATYSLSGGRDPFNATNGMSVSGNVTLVNARMDLKGSATTNGGFVPLRAIMMYSGDTPPPGWAFCDGSTINGIVTPDLRGRFVLGSGNNISAGLTNRVLNTKGGQEYRVLSKDEMPKHSHTVPFETFDNAAARSDGKRDVAGPGYDAWDTWNSFTSSEEGAGLPHSIMPPFWVLAYIIRVQ